MINRRFAFAAALLIGASASLQVAAEPSAKPATAVKPAKTASTRATGPRGPRSAKSLDCSKQADGKNLHGAARTSFMRSCNKG